MKGYEDLCELLTDWIIRHQLTADEAITQLQLQVKIFKASTEILQQLGLDPDGTELSELK